MECMISLGVISCAFASDCSNMISLLDNQDDWPTFAAELVLDFFPVILILEQTL
ncbi:unnamed protein product [Arabidopsis halleri]